MAARRASSSLWRGIIVALGCISAVWLIFNSCESIASMIRSFIANDYNFLDYFFHERLSAFASLFIGISFFAIIIRDLWALKKPFLYISIVFSVLCCIAVLVNSIILPIINNSIVVNFELSSHILLVLQMIAYIIFASAGIRSKRYQPSAFYFGFFCFLFQLIYQIAGVLMVDSSPDLSIFIPYLTVFFANIFVFKCSLYEK